MTVEELIEELQRVHRLDSPIQLVDREGNEANIEEIEQRGGEVFIKISGILL